MKAAIPVVAILALVIVMPTWGHAADSTAVRTWTSRDGKHTTEAALVGFRLGNAVLRKSDGSEVEVPVTKLGDEDQAFVAKNAKDDEESVAALIKKQVALKKNKAGQVIEAVFPQKMKAARQETLVPTRVGQREMSLLSGLPNLQRLSLAGVRLSDGALEEINKLYNLRQLDVSATSIGNAEMNHLAELAKLELLYLSGTRITNRGVAFLKQFPKLNELALANTRIGDEGIAHLEEIKTLKKLNLSNVRISPTGILSLRKALPNTAMEGSGVVRR